MSKQNRCKLEGLCPEKGELNLLVIVVWVTREHADESRTCASKVEITYEDRRELKEYGTKECVEKLYSFTFKIDWGVMLSKRS
jgi:hypothetical protein